MDRAMTHLSRNLLRNGCSSRVPSATMEVPFAPAAAASATFAGPATTRATTTMMLVELLLKLMLLRSTTACTVAPRNEAQLLPLGTQDLARDLHIFGQLLSAEGLRDLVHTSPELAPEKECPSEVLQGLYATWKSSSQIPLEGMGVCALIPKEVQGDDPHASARQHEHRQDGRCLRRVLLARGCRHEASRQEFDPVQVLQQHRGEGGLCQLAERPLQDSHQRVKGGQVEIDVRVPHIVRQPHRHERHDSAQ
mmetsp:Transcript_121428/g.303022  ORF Transcript_121428/g.303022 Transcript_121428/m.303022 type:complete len:251 (-) Transcript_121428:1753-2505(-)